MLIITVMSNTGALTQVLLCFSLRKRCQTFIWWWMLSNLWKALQCDPRWLLKSVFQMWHISMTDGCQMAACERAEKGTILTYFCLTPPLDPQEKADTRGSIPGEARLNTEPQEHHVLAHTTFYAVSQFTRAGFLHSQKQKSRENREARLFPSWQELSLCSTQIPTKPFTEISVRSLLGQTQPSGATSLLSDQGMFRW